MNDIIKKYLSFLILIPIILGGTLMAVAVLSVLSVVAGTLPAVITFVIVRLFVNLPFEYHLLFWSVLMGISIVYNISDGTKLKGM
jgi:hypothetical protein